MTESVESHDIRKLIESMHALTVGMNELVKSNAMVVQCLVEAMADEEDQPQSIFLDGSPIINNSL